MLAAERYGKILEILQSERKVEVADLAERFDCSQETIRRDLDKMDRDGIAIKGYGGAVLNETDGSDSPFHVRAMKNPDKKRHIADIVKNLINDGDHIFIDPSTTCVAIAKAIKNKQRLSVVTNSIEILENLSDVSDWEIISSGGHLKENYLALVGQGAASTFENYNADKAIVSCKALDITKGATDSNELFSQVKRSMLKNAAVKILAVDSTKFGEGSFAKICELSEFDMIITDSDPGEEWREYLKSIGVQCLY